MKIAYRHSNAPEVVKIHDTEKSLKGCEGFIRSLGGAPKQSDWDKRELERFLSDVAKGVILDYWIVEGAYREDLSHLWKEDEDETSVS